MGDLHGTLGTPDPVDGIAGIGQAQLEAADHRDAILHTQ